jgi:hypothetical protein
MRASRRPRTVAVLVAAAALCACDRGAPPVHVVSVRVAQGALSEPLREAGLDDAALEAGTRDALAAAGFRVGDGKRPHRARVDVLAVRLAPGQGGGPRVEVAVEIELAPAESGAEGVQRESGTGSAPFAPGLPADPWRAALSAAARDAADGLALAFAEAAKPLEAVIRDLGAPTARVRQQAIRVLAERRDPSAVPALIEHLDDPDPEVVHRVVGALAQIGDPRAVGPLIDVSRREDGALLSRVARIIGDIGGQEAEGYLLTLEAGHPDGRIRQSAREALDELRARDAAQAARTPPAK